MCLDILCIVRIYITASIVLDVLRPRRLVLGSVPLRAESIVFLLDDKSNQVLTSPADDWLMGEAEGLFMILVHMSDLATAM